MAKTTYPMIPTNVWWKLRDQFQKSIPPVVTRSYLATVLKMKESSAANILGPLRAVGLIDEENQPEDLANRWRFDEDYPAVCEAIREKVYPAELLHAISEPSTDRDGTVRWFMRNAGVGEGGARKMATTYQLLMEADPAAKPQQQDHPSATEKTRRPTKRVARTTSTSRATRGTPASNTVSQSTGVSTSAAMPSPSVHIDVQVHISPNASPDQIEQIFASMAKHLYMSAQLSDG